MSEPSAPAVASTRQAASLSFSDDGGAIRKGTEQSGHLGSSVVSCPIGGYAATAPGDDSVWLSPAQTRLVTPRAFAFEVDPFPVVCLGTNPNTLRVLVGGPSTAWSLKPDGGVQVSAQRINAFDATPGAWLAVGRASPGNISLFPSNAASLASPTFVSSPAIAGVGTAVAWNAGGALLVGNPLTRSAAVHLPDMTADGGLLLVAPFVLNDPEPALPGGNFGAVVATGDVLPLFSEEHIVAAPAVGRVYVFSGLAHVLTLRGGPSFGAALTVEPQSFGGGLHALWVGEPDANRVHRFIGSEGQMFPAPPAAANNSKFGAAIAVDSQGVLVVGAPRYSEGIMLEVGAVFEATIDAGALVGVVMTCDAGQSCALAGCTTGTCLGSVFCEQVRSVGSDCNPNQTCNMNVCVDGGVPDAGRDGGSSDGGSSDGGSSDGGTTDGGATDGGTDGGTADGGTTDGGTTDGGTADGGGGTTDAGADGGLSDAGPFADAGIVQEPLTYDTTGCGCSAGDLPMLMLLGLATRRRKRG